MENKTQTGAVVTFQPGVTKEQAIKLLQQFAERLKLEGMNVQEYNPEWGSPVFYVP